MSSLSPQSILVYQALLSTPSLLTVKEIAHNLDLAPQAVYRLLQPLLDIGLIKKVDSHPTCYVAKPSDQGLGLFLLYQTKWFDNHFTSASKTLASYQTKKKTNVKNLNRSSPSTDMEQTFIQSRKELMRYAAKEIEASTVSIDLLRSGHEMTPEVTLACRQAIKRGVVLRMLVQDTGPAINTRVALWQQNGFRVKKTIVKQLRLQIYDSQVLYFMSYKHRDSTQDTGMRIAYPPLAVLMSQVFEKLWQEGEQA